MKITKKKGDGRGWRKQGAGEDYVDEGERKRKRIITAGQGQGGGGCNGKKGPIGMNTSRITNGQEGKRGQSR